MIQHALDSLELILLIKQEIIWLATLRWFFNQLGIITTTCYIKKVNIATTREEWILLQKLSILINRRWCYNYYELHVDIVTTV